MGNRSEIISAYVAYQDALQEWGVGPAAYDALNALCYAVGRADVWEPSFDRMLERIHRLAYDDDPPRLIIEIASPFEN